MSTQQPVDHLLAAAELAVAEIHRRLRDNPRDIPDHVLSKMVTDLNKFLERRDRGDDEDSKPFTLLDNLSTLPPERAKELLRSRIEELQAEMDSLYEYEATLLLGGTNGTESQE